jgi:hypothetical protein
LLFVTEKVAKKVAKSNTANPQVPLRFRKYLANRFARKIGGEGMLRDYDTQIVGHWKHITRLRNLQGATLYPIYFQYLALLVTEVYLDQFFHDQAKLLESLNDYRAKIVGDLDGPEITPFGASDLNMLAFWMATGSGKNLRSLSEKFKQGKFEALSFQNLEIFKADRHLYQPLVHLAHGAASQDALIKVVPTHLNEGEKRFVDDLVKFCKTETKGLLAETELYLLRNHNSDKAISFFAESGFRPDFILWLLREGKQTITFLDPKGLRNFTDNFQNPKVKLAQRIKVLETDLKRPDIRLESFLISQTHRHLLKWPSPGSPDQKADAEEYRKHHILSAKDDPDTYVGQLMAVLL